MRGKDPSAGPGQSAGRYDEGSDTSQRAELWAPDDEGFYTSQLHDWVPLCPQLRDSAIRLYWIMRALVIEKRGPVRKLTLLQLCHLLPSKQMKPGEAAQPSSLSRVRGLLSELSEYGLLSTPEGGPIKSSSRASASAAPLRIRINDRPSRGYAGPRNAFALLDEVREPAEAAAVEALRKERERAARRRAERAQVAGQISGPPDDAGQISGPSGQISGPRGQISGPDSVVDLQKPDLPFRPSAQTYRSEGGGSLRPSLSVSDEAGVDTDGGTDGSGDVIEDQDLKAANAPETEEATTAGSEKAPSPGETLLRRIGRHHPEIAAGLAMGSTLADQGRVVNTLLAAGITHEEIRSVLLDRPYPEPAERTHTMASLIAGRLARIPLPPIGYSSQLPAQAAASGPTAWPEVSQGQSRPTPPAAHRSCEGEIGTAFCERLALPGSRLCARCTKNAEAAAAQPPAEPDEWQQAVAAVVGSTQA
ncbi:hypothetical protein J8N05_46995 (plasmid) [Streptomyces sp. BH-SS-21]|uniref:Uncharacterized protein n=1 Tax=Streptomyces liliiviolaceus TaxID=2823109 RepID=A0A940Y1S6_9ACTN|nr:hypothetical protein [Streptomyces liliiviolaceus]MBQ0855709.1 hypothetical protein [Streptomyces liliiviolaceus]